MIPTTNEKKKRVSKKRKSSWRKHVDIKDVDEFLDEQRLEERLGEPFSTLKDEELFTISTDAQDKPLSLKERKRLRLTAPPRCFSMLQPHTKVPDPIKKRNHVRTKAERMCPILKRREDERKLKGVKKHKELQSIKDREKHQELKRDEKKGDESPKDIWNEDNKDDANWLDKNTKRHTLRWLGKLNKITPRVKTDKNAAIPNVEIPHPGTSYNPSFKDHNDLLTAIVAKETKIIKQERHIQRVTKDMFRKMTADATRNDWMIEMSQGLPEQNGNKDDEKNDGDDRAYISINPPVENKKKTLKQRRKQREQLELKKQLLSKRLEKKKVADIYKLKMIKQQIEQQEQKLAREKVRKEKLRSFKEKEPKQLGRLKFEEPDVNFNMIEDLSGNLRNVKTEGSVLADRFYSMQKRNIIPVTLRHNRKKAKVKKFVKPGFKDDWKQTVASVNIVPTR